MKNFYRGEDEHGKFVKVYLPVRRSFALWLAAPLVVIAIMAYALPYAVVRVVVDVLRLFRHFGHL